MAYRTLEMTLISAKDLRNVNLISKMEVYAIASISGDPRSKQRTLTDRDGGTNPTWNHTFKFTVPDQDPGRIVIHVLLRSERALGDRDVGEVHVPLRELLDTYDKKPATSSQYVSYQVRTLSSGKSKGILNISYKLGDLVTVAAPPVANKIANPVGAYPTPAPYHAADPYNAYPPPPAHNFDAYPPPTTAYPPPASSKVNEPVTAYPAASSSAAYPPPGGPHVGYAYGPPPPQPYGGYGGYPPPASQAGYGGYPPPPPQGSYGYGYGAPPQVAQPAKKNKFGMGLGAGLLGGALGGMLIGDMVSDAGSYDAGYDDGYDAGYNDDDGFGDGVDF